MLAYAFSWEFLAIFSPHPVIVICTIVLYFHMLTAGNKRPGRLKLYLAVLALLGSGIIMTTTYQDSNHLSDELYMSQIYPPALRISRDHQLEEFMADMQSLKAQVDEERKDNADKDNSDKNTSDNPQN